MSRVYLNGYRSIPTQEFEVGPFTVMFGKNNAGKTYLLEALYSVLAPQSFADGHQRTRGLRGDDGALGAIYVDLERGLEFDNAILDLVPEDVEGGVLQLQRLPQDQVCFASTPNNESLPNPGYQPELWFVDLADYWTETDAHGLIVDEECDELYVVDERTRLVGAEPSLRPLFLEWEFSDVDQWVTSVIVELTTVPDRMQDTNGGFPFTHIPGSRGFLRRARDSESAEAWIIRPEVRARLSQLAELATNLLPDFLDGSIQTALHVPTDWDDSPRVRVEYRERGSSSGYPVPDFGRGTSRWLSIALQVALHVMEQDWLTSALPAANADKRHSGSVLLIDEPEAHLHPSAVASVIRWCQRMVQNGFQIVAASHHEEFLRADGDDITFVQVTRGVETEADDAGEIHHSLRTRIRTLASTATPILQGLAAEIGLHPASALSLHRALLFVEGPLDEAMLDEYAGPQLDAAGVLVVPIHGTKNLEGLIDGEFTTRLGIKAGILTDNTQTDTLLDRSNRKRSSEEIKLVRLIKRFQDQGLPAPALFGVPEDDLLFALPAEAIRDYLQGPFPGWHELREECRAAEGLGPSDSVDWKSYALTHYGLPLTAAGGVRSIIRALDLAAVDMPSIRTVVAEVLNWAAKSP